MANITEKYQQAKDAGYSDAEIQAFMAQAMTTGGPGVDKPGLPDSRTLPTPKNFPGFGNPAAEYARRQEPVNRILDGAARMTGSAARRSGGDVADARFGGASDIMRGAAEIAAPLAAVPLAGAGSIGAGAAMLGRMAIGAGGGYLGGKLLRAQVPDDQPGLQDFVENAGATAGGLLAGGVSESPKVGAFVKGAAKAAPKAMVRSGPYGMGGVVMHAMGHNKLGLAADAVAAAAGLPTVIRGGMAEAAGKPWLGAGASRLFGVNKPQQAPATNPKWQAARQEGIRLRGLMDAAEEPAPAPTLEIPVKPELPSGRKPGGIWNQDKVLTPAEIIAADAKSKAAIEALKARQAAKQNQRPAPTPKPAANPTTPSENAAARMAAQDAAGQERTGLMNDVAGKNPQGRAADTRTPKAETKPNLMDEAVAQAEAEAAAAVKDLEWRKRSGTIGEKMTKTKQDALIDFAAEKGKPMTAFTESEYNDLVSQFNAAGKKRATGKPFKMNFAGADYDADGRKYGRDVEMTLRHFNNMRLGKK